MKYIVFLGDGMADTPVAELGGKTPLEAAKHPNMDKLASKGIFGMVSNVPDGMKPGSDTANLSVFGYDPKIYYSGRSPLEAASMGIDLEPDDVTYRCNFVTISDPDDFEHATMVDYCSDEIETEEAGELVDLFNDRFASDTVHLYHGIYYRQCLVLKHAATGADLVQPHDIPGQPVADKLPNGTNSELLREMMAYARETFKDHPVNKSREARGLHPANEVWFWGEGRKPALKPFKELYGLNGTVISAVDLIQGIGKCAEMEVLHVPGATGNYKTDFSAKAQAAIDAFKRGSDYVYIHMEAPDECGHQHQIKEKVWSIEQIDEKVMAPVLEYLDHCGEDYVALVLPDHPTPLDIRTHTSNPVPFAMYFSADVKNGPDTVYTEENARTTGLYLKDGCRLTDMMLGRK